MWLNVPPSEVNQGTGFHIRKPNLTGIGGSTMLLERFLRRKKKFWQPRGYARKIRPTQGVSYPRSGHALVYQIAIRYFGEAFIYCDANNTNHCGCESVPCINPARTFAKNHDFSLKHSGGMPVIPSERYFIQFRSPVRSIASNYYLFRRNKFSRRKKSEWQKFALDSIEYWNRFVDKWVLNFPGDANPPFYCSYESLLSDPDVRMREVLSFLSEDPLEDDAITGILREIPIVDRSSIKGFRYYDEGFFREIEARTSGRLARLELPSFDEGY